ncbi:cytochrome P450 4C1-like [Periplaneta americana]|uniref:cytochrome P450 4C1-like n=1 Tax=Periplaneta americana TaxID=6978 RepID=UPI0037E8FDC1
MGCNSKEYWYVTDRIALKYGDIFKIQMGTKLYVLIWNPKYIEVLLSSTKEIEKGFGYNFLTPWLGYGLLTSKGQRWHSHRKFLTPAFHFKILEQFVGVFNNNGKILLENLSKHVNGPEFEITQYIELCTLDNIAETAMGVTLNCQRGGSMEYVHAVRSMDHLAYDRIARPWLYPDFIFSLSPQRRQQERNLSVLHGLTKSIIKIKKEEIQNSGVQPMTTQLTGVQPMTSYTRVMFILFCAKVN